MQELWQDRNITVAIQKDNPPAKLAIYAKSKGLIYSHGWQWAWQMLKSSKRFVCAVKMMKGAAASGAKYKFGVQVPWNIRKAICLDCENGNMLWQDRMQEEIDQLLQFKTFWILPQGVKTFDNIKKYTYVPMHFVFDVKFDLQQKAQCLVSRNWTNLPNSDVFSGVVLIENVWLGLFVLVLNGLQICAADVGNAFLHGGYTKELVYTIAGPEWGNLAGCIMIVVWSIYRRVEDKPSQFSWSLGMIANGLGLLSQLCWHRHVDERLHDSLQVHLYLRWWFADYVQGPNGNDYQGAGKGVSSQRSWCSGILPSTLMGQWA